MTCKEFKEGHGNHPSKIVKVPMGGHVVANQMFSKPDLYCIVFSWFRKSCNCFASWGCCLLGLGIATYPNCMNVDLLTHSFDFVSDIVVSVRMRH